MHQCPDGLNETNTDVHRTFCLLAFRASAKAVLINGKSGKASHETSCTLTDCGPDWTNPSSRSPEPFPAAALASTSLRAKDSAIHGDNEARIDRHSLGTDPAEVEDIADAVVAKT